MDYGAKELGMNKVDRGLYTADTERDNCGAGFVCDLKGRKSNDIIHKALQILVRLTHRGAVSADKETGDGAGIMLKIPHEFFEKRCREEGFSLPAAGEYAVGMVFLPRDIEQRQFCVEAFNTAVTETAGLKLLGWREVPVNRDAVGRIARETEPFMMQVFVGKEKGVDARTFVARLYLARRIAENKVWNSDLCEKGYFYFPTLSTTTICYKGLLMPESMVKFYKDLADPEMATSLALVHQRFSTNTFPTWDLAHPFRYLCHNGEINTLRGNVNRMRAREELFASELFGDDIKKLSPIIVEGKSDSASLDMAVELLTHTGRSLPEIMMMMVPEAWEKHGGMSEDKKAFYEYASCLMEPWDGPASIPFTDGHYVGALLDRNGLRPSRYTVTKDGILVMGSEVGVIDFEPENIAKHGRLEPGKMFLVDMEAGRIVEDEEIKALICKSKPYRKWLDESLVRFSQLEKVKYDKAVELLPLKQRQQIFGYTQEDLSIIITPMATRGEEAIGSMGTDAPIAVLSDKPRLLYDYFKQLFAQVTNPPLDGIREELVTSLDLNMGSAHNIFHEGPEHCRRLKLEDPIITNAQLEILRALDQEDLRAVTLPILFKAADGRVGLERALEELVIKAVTAVDAGKTILILSDRGVNKEMAPIPALLALSSLHHSLVRLGRRSRAGLVMETAEAREVHHFATLFGYSVSAINPYLAFETIEELIATGRLTETDPKKAVKNFIKASGKGLVKVMTKIGISTLHSYRGAQIFEAIGLNRELVDRHFCKTQTRISGIGMAEIAADAVTRHAKAFPKVAIAGNLDLEVGGEYQWRRNGERHLFNPFTIAKLQDAVRRDFPQSYAEYAKAINDQSKTLLTLRGLMEFVGSEAVPLDEVESWEDIVKRFKTGAMSYGSISLEAHENLAIAMNRLGGKSNSGEGGENPNRFAKDANGDWRNSAIKQVASGRFGVTSHYLANALEIQIKMAQGAKPGEGGQLPGDKVSPEIAACRHSTPWVGLISPPPHHDIYSIEDLAQLIYDLKNANNRARINVKLVSEVGVGTVAAGVAKAKADVILVSGYDGGTGASPLTSLKHAGLPWELGIAEAQQTLVMNDMRGRIVLECDGQLKTGRDVAIACLLGAEEFGFATAPLVASGCIMMRVCHLNTCPVGVATQDPELRKKFAGKPEHVVNFMRFVAEELRQIMAQLGFRTINEMIGRSDKLQMRKAIEHYKAKGLDYSKILYRPEVPDTFARRNVSKQDHNLEQVMDERLHEICRPAIEQGQTVKWEGRICNEDRSVGAILSSKISRRYGAAALPEDSIQLTFRGMAGLSLGAFTVKGITITSIGATNDFLGKGLSGGKIIVRPPETATFKAEENVITGNVCFYGATSGEAYIRGIAGERFCVRNSGANTVVEGVGDHGCEYMTGGRVVVLGRTGRNFAAGMSGGIAYVLDEVGDFATQRCNLEMVGLEAVSGADEVELKALISKHAELTGSELATRLLKDWARVLPRFVKVMPTDYKKALERLAKDQSAVKA